MDAAETGGRRALLGQLLRALKPAALHRPLRADDDPPASRPIIVAIALLYATAAMVSLTQLAQSGWNIVPIAVMIGLLYVITDMLPVQMSEGVHVSSGEVFVLTAAATLPVEGYALILLVCPLIVMLYEQQSWYRGLMWGANGITVLLGATLGVSVTRALVGPTWELPIVLLLGGLLGMRLFDNTVNATTIWWASNALGRPAATSWFALVRMLTIAEHQVIVTLTLELPMVLIGIYLYQVAPWTIAFLATPYFLLYYGRTKAVQLEHAHQRMQIDPHTGLANRARFFDVGSFEVTAADRYGHSLWLVMGDLDNFKRINDTLGHVAGDEVLRLAAEQILTVTANHDVVAARYGGEEFAVLAPAATAAEVQEIAATIRAGVQAALHTKFDTTISLGVAQLRDGDRLTDLIERADQALYAAKMAGKNRVFEWVDENRCVELRPPLRRVA